MLSYRQIEKYQTQQNTNSDNYTKSNNGPFKKNSSLRISKN